MLLPLQRWPVVARNLHKPTYGLSYERDDKNIAKPFLYDEIMLFADFSLKYISIIKSNDCVQIPTHLPLLH